MFTCGAFMNISSKFEVNGKSSMLKLAEMAKEKQNAFKPTPETLHPNPSLIKPKPYNL